MDIVLLVVKRSVSSSNVIILIIIVQRTYSVYEWQQSGFFYPAGHECKETARYFFSEVPIKYLSKIHLN